MPATATIIHVLPDGTGDVPTIAEALEIAVSGDTIALGDGVFYEHDLPLKTGVSIISDSGDPANTVIDAEFAGRCLYGRVTGAPDFIGVTLQNGVDDVEGGLLLADDNNVRFTDCVFRNGSAPIGGAAALTGWSIGGAPYFVNCRFEFNEATSDGGAIWARGVGYFELCEFIGNTAQGNGGAVLCNKESGQGVWLRTCRFEGNEAGGDGGAVFSTGGGWLYDTWITIGEFVGNSATRGGAAYLDNFDFALESTFLDNEASEAGGALYLVDIRRDKEFHYFTLNLFARNRAGTHGGAIAVTGFDSFLVLRKSTLSDNEALSGSHIWSDIPAMWGDLYRSILAFARGGGAVAGLGTLDASCSDVFANLGGDYVGPLAGEDSSEGNISEDPLFCDREMGDYTLTEGSPCYQPLPPGCGDGIIGRFGIGCSPSSVPDAPVDGAVKQSTWGRIKANYR
jgi:predicted outer membrane repeat protein